MIALADVFRGITLVFGAVLVGAMVMEVRMILPLFKASPPAEGFRIVTFLSPIAWRYLPASGAIATLSAVAVAALQENMTAPATGFTIAGIVLALSGVYASAVRYGRQDRALRARAEPPPDYPDVVRRLERAHVARMGLFGSAYVCWVVAALLV